VAIDDGAAYLPATLPLPALSHRLPAHLPVPPTHYCCSHTCCLCLIYTSSHLPAFYLTLPSPPPATLLHRTFSARHSRAYLRLCCCCSCLTTLEGMGDRRCRHAMPSPPPCLRLYHPSSPSSATILPFATASAPALCPACHRPTYSLYPSSMSPLPPYLSPSFISSIIPLTITFAVTLYSLPSTFCTVYDMLRLSVWPSALFTTNLP